MIRSLRLVNFKNFADETLHLGPFTLIVGANASGKSNIRDAFRFLHGISRNYTLAETFGGKYAGGGQLEWAGIRGAPNEIIHFERSAFSLEAELEVLGMESHNLSKAFYSIEVGFRPDSTDGFYVLTEALRTELKQVYTTMVTPDPGLKLRIGESNVESSHLSRFKPILTQYLFPIFPEQQQFMQGVRAALNRLRFLDLWPEGMRLPSLPGATVLGETGSDLPTVLQAICREPARKEVLLSWLRELTPMDVRDLRFIPDPNGRVHLRILEVNGSEVSAYSASDGTLRFLATLASLLSEQDPSLYFFEEIDNGIHPARLSLLIDLIERQTAKGKIQVIATTHSPDVLNLINDTTFENAVVVYRDEDSADAVIRRVAELPNARELRKSQGLGRLHAGGWMENILSFAETDGEGQKDGE